MCCTHWCGAAGADVVVCVHAGKDGFLGNCAILNLIAYVVCGGIVEASVGCGDAQVCNSLRPAEGLGWGDGCWSGRSYLLWRHNGQNQGCVPPKQFLWPNPVPSWVAPLEVCVGIVMVTGYGCVLWGPAVSMLVEVPLALGRCPLPKGVHWLHWQPYKIHCGGHRVLGG